MKKIYLLILIQIITGKWCLSQNAATPNPGFENWTQVGNHFDPDNWNTLNPNTGIIGVFTCTRASGADVHSGTYAIKLTTKSVFGITANGIASTATLITTPPYGVTGGIPYSQRPDSITGWYKYTPASAADSGFAQFVLLGASNDTIGFVKFNTPNTAVSAYTRFSRPITYFSAATPTLSYWILSSSNGSNPVVNSAIIFDDINLVFNATGVQEPVHQDDLHVQFNMIDSEMYFMNHTGNTLLLRVYDQSGRIVFSDRIADGSGSSHMDHLRAGIYYYQVSGDTHQFYTTGKFLKP